MTNIAFDLDGVFVADYHSYPTGNLSEAQINAQRAFFKPDFPFYIITGRESKMRMYTQQWLDLVDLHPIELFHDNLFGHEDGASYKLATLQANPQITRFYESSQKQVDFIRAGLMWTRSSCKVIHFASWLSQRLKIG